VQRNRQKDWVRKLFVPYVIFFALSCLISAISMFVKMQIIRQKFSSRHEAAALMAAPEPASPTMRLRQSPRAKPSEESTAFAKAVKVAAHESTVAALEAKVHRGA